MEPDLYRSGYIIYTDEHSLKSTDGVTSELIAGNTTEQGYRKGKGRAARFRYFHGFKQISPKEVIAADNNNHCLRRIHRDTGLTTTFSGVCTSPGYQDGALAKFVFPIDIIRDNQNIKQLLVTDEFNNAIRTVAVSDGSVGTLRKSDSINSPLSLTQNTAGDIFVTTVYAVHRISYAKKTITLIAGSPFIEGYRDSSLLNSLFFGPTELIFIRTNKLLIADEGTDKLRLLHLDKDKVTTLNLCNGCQSGPALLYHAY